MRRFVFKLDPLLEQRRRVERDHRVKVAAIESERSALESELRSMSQQAERSREGLRDALTPGGQSAAGLADAARWQATATMSMDARARSIAVKLAGVLKRLEAARALLVEASKERRAVERLRERRHDAFVRESARAELAELDDITTMRAGTPANGG